MDYGKIFRNGVITENPTFVQVIGMCPVLAVTTSANNAIGMGLAATAVLIGSNVVISLLRKFVPDQVRIPCFVVVIATFVTIVQLLLQAYLPALNSALGIFIPLIVVNCIILARAEAFAFKNKPLASLIDGLGMGIGFTVALIIIGSVRELIGNGTLFGAAVLADTFPRTMVMILPPGAFFTLGLLMAWFNRSKGRN